MSSSNGCWYKKPGWIVSVLAGLAVIIGGYSVMKYQVGNHETRIKTVEGDQSTIKERLSSIETSQKAQALAMQNMLQEMRRIHTVPAGGP